MTKSDLKRDFSFTLGETTRLCRLAMDRQMKPLGLSQATWRTLFWLDRHDEGITQKMLADKMGIEGPTLVRLIDNLERNGLVERQPSLTDRRANILRLTAKARPVVKMINRVAEEVRAELLDGLDDGALRSAQAVLQHMIGNATRIKSNLARSA